MPLDQRESPGGRLYNRIPAVLAHTTRFAFEPQARLAAAVGVSKSTISRTLAGRSRPSLPLAQRIAAVLSDDLGVCVGVGDLFSPDGTYPTRSACRLCGCDGCFPPWAHDARGRLRPEFRGQKPGDWTLAPASRLPQV